MIVAIAMLTGIASCRQRARVIPANKMVDIYAEMLLSDQWIKQADGARAKADTTLVYDAIFHKYGYDRQDYYATIDYYIDRPEDFHKLTERVVGKLKKEHKERKDLLALKDSIDKLNAPYKKYVRIDFDEDSVRWNIDVQKYLEEINKHIIKECDTAKSTAIRQKKKNLPVWNATDTLVLKD